MENNQACQVLINEIEKMMPEANYSTLEFVYTFLLSWRNGAGD